MKTIFSFFATILFTANAFPQSSAELTCRAQAKEIALQTYSSCITEARNNKVEEIRKNYQKAVSDAKARAEKELKELKGSNTPKATKNETVTVSQARAPRPVKGVAKTLPSRAPVATPDETKVVATGTEEASAALENEAQNADQTEFIEMPTE